MTTVTTFGDGGAVPSDTQRDEGRAQRPYLRLRSDYPTPKRLPRSVGHLLIVVLGLAAAGATLLTQISLGYLSPMIWALSLVVGAVLSFGAYVDIAGPNPAIADPFPSERHPEVTVLVSSWAARYAVDVDLYQRRGSKKSRTTDGVESSVAASAGRSKDRYYIVVSDDAMAWAPDDSDSLAALLAHEMTHIIRDHPTVNVLAWRLLASLPGLVALSMTAHLAQSGPLPGTVSAACFVALAYVSSTLSGRQIRMLSPLKSRFVAARERVAERGSIGLLGPRRALLAALCSAAASTTRDVPFMRPGEPGAGYFSDADTLAEATGYENWRDPDDEAWAWAWSRLDPRSELKQP